MAPETTPPTRTAATVVALVAWTALFLQFLVSLVLNPVPGVPTLLVITNVLSYFTILSNLQVAIVTTAIALAPNPRPNKRPPFLLRPTTQAAVAIYITVVGITYSLLLRGIVPLAGTASLADHLLHDAVPLLYPILWFIFLSPRQALPWRASLPWLWWPAIYLAYALTRGALHNFYLYPFLNISALGLPKVLIAVAGISLTFFLLGLLGHLHHPPTQPLNGIRNAFLERTYPRGIVSRNYWP